MVESFKCTLKNWTKFTNARTSRTDFWLSYLAEMLIVMVAEFVCFIPMIIGAITGDYDVLAVTTIITWILAAIVSIGSIIISIAIYAAMARRLTDAGFSWAFIFLSLAGLGIVPLIMACLPTKSTYIHMPYVGVSPAEPENPFQPQYQQPTYQAPTQPQYQQPTYQAPAQPQYQQPVYQAPVAPAANANWFCPNCGTSNTTEFCSNCGTKRV